MKLFKFIFNSIHSVFVLNRKNPFFFFFVLLALLSLFKPYPSISDLSIYLALLPQWSHLFECKYFFIIVSNNFYFFNNLYLFSFKDMKQGLVVGCIFVSCSALAPIMWQMWIILGTANSNFYFGVTLAYNAAQVIMQ